MAFLKIVMGQEFFSHENRGKGLRYYGHMLIMKTEVMGGEMARPKHRRRVCCLPDAAYFKPRGIPLSSLKEVVMTIDEFEALRLSDLEGKYHSDAATEMKVSRQTFGRIVQSARRKVAEALVKGKALVIKGGDFEMEEMRHFCCDDCGSEFEAPRGTGRPDSCPRCHCHTIRRVDRERSFARRGEGKGGRGSCGQRMGEGRCGR